MQKFVKESFVQHLVVCQQYLQAHKQTKKERKKERKKETNKHTFGASLALSTAESTPAVRQFPLYTPVYSKNCKPITDNYLSLTSLLHVSTFIRSSSGSYRQRHTIKATCVV
jgi:hypothetical protein